MVIPPLLHPRHTFGGRDFDLRTSVVLMAIINRTPDSFFDRGRTLELDAAVHAGITAAEHGAEIIDIGGVPFAPGDPLPAREEADRVVPVVREIARTTRVSISVDTFHASVADDALGSGACIINDTTGCSDPDMARVVAEHDAYLVITHSLAAPRTTLAKPQYDDPVAEVRDFLTERVERALAAGVRVERIIIDPGFDLNKNTLHSLELLRRLDEIADLGYPLLSAPSNKDFIGESVGAPRQNRGAGSITSAVASVYGGARIVRMHDVKASRQALDMLSRIHGWEAPVTLHHNMGDENFPPDIFDPAIQ